MLMVLAWGCRWGECDGNWWKMSVGGTIVVLIVVFNCRSERILEKFREYVLEVNRDIAAPHPIRL